MTGKTESQPRKKRPSIKDVARHAGVSTATVSHVFSRKKHVNETLEQRVLHAAEVLGYAMDRTASRLRSGRMQMVAVIVPDLVDLFLSQFVANVEAHAEQAGYEVIVVCSRNDPQVERTRLRSLLGWRPSGIIAVPCSDSFPQEFLDELGDIPMVAADRVRPGSNRFDTVTVDNFGSGQQTVDHLIARGARSILFVAATLDLLTIRERVRAAKHCVAGVPDATLSLLEIGSDPKTGAQRLEGWLRENPLPDAVVGLTNVTTLAVLSAFASLNLNPPQDVLLFGYHDSLWMTARKTPVTTLQQPVDGVARYAWDLLMHRMSDDTSPPQNIVLSSTLIERASTMKTPQGA